MKIAQLNLIRLLITMPTKLDHLDQRKEFQFIKVKNNM